MVCDDSALVRRAISGILEADPGLLVVARVADGKAALDAVVPLAIDVVVLDIEMPVMDGLTALPLLLRASPGLGVVIASTLTTRGADVAMQALRLGAAATVAKPTAAALNDGRFAADLLASVKGVGRLRRVAAGAAAAPAAEAFAVASGPKLPPQLVAIGSSTGGPNAVFALMRALEVPLRLPVVLTQHMPANFTAMFAEHVNRLGIMPCAEARDGEPILPGRILLAPGGRHLLVRRKLAGLVAELSNGPPENFCRPAVDPMLRSAAIAVDGRVLVVMLTGMGQDGLIGTRAVVEAGGAALAQDEASSVVWGMPGAIVRGGLAHAVLPPTLLAARLHDMLGRAR